MLYQHVLGIDPPPFAGVMMTGARLHLGNFVEANAQFTKIIAAHTPDQLLQLQESQGSNYAALALGWQSHGLWCLGYPQQAYRRALQAVKIVKDLDQPFNQALVATYVAMLQQFRAERAVAQEHAELALALSQAHQAPYYGAWADILVRYGLAIEHPDAQHIEQLCDSITIFKATSARLRLPYYLALLAQVYVAANNVEEGLNCLNEALTAARTHNERWWDAELHRLRGELLHLHGAEPSDVEAAFLRAINIAQAQQAKSLELRATMSLAQLWREQHRAADAKEQLVSVYRWFTEGAETPDLQAARHLIEQL
jgi:tetratricopeptide (TPR) repeat protein